MLKFVSTKPPRLKDGHIVEGQGYGKHTGSHLSGTDYNFSGDNYIGTVDRSGTLYGNMRGLSNEMDRSAPSYGQMRGLSSNIDRSASLYGQMRGPSNDMERNAPPYSQMRGLSHDKETLYRPTEHWRAYNKKYGKIGLEKEISLPVRQQYVTPDNQHAFINNRDKFDTNYNPIQGNDIGYTDLDDIRNANVQTVTSQGYGAEVPRDTTSVPGGRGHGGQFGTVRPYSFSPESTAHRQYQLINGSMHSPMRFSTPAPYTSSGYGPPYNLDSTGSISIDSMSTSGDRSSKSVSETMDFDGAFDASSEIRQRLDLKPHLVSDQHRHVHVGRGTHGLCDSPATSPVRPGTALSDSHTSSLRKSPSFRTGHRVRWDPGVMNSKQDSKQTYGEPVKQETHPKKKKRTSLRSLLNLPKFPLSDEEVTDHSDSGLSSRVTEQTQQSVKRKKTIDTDQKEEPAKAPELASLRYRTEFMQKEMPNLNQIHTEGSIKTNVSTASDFQGDFHSIPSGLSYEQRKSATGSRGIDEIDFVTGMQVLDYEKSAGRKPGVGISDTSQVMGLYVSRASEQTYDSVPYSYDMQGSSFGQHEGISTETKSVSQPVMHSGFQSKPQIFQKQDVYLKPELKQTRNINSVQPYLINGQQNDLDYDNYSQPGLQTDSISVTKENIFSSSQLTNDVSYGTEKSDTHSGENTTVPVTFDTFVTFGGPSMSNVTFDRFVTLGRPYATSTPVPNGTSSWRLDQDRYKHRKEGERGLESLSGPFQTKVTQSWKYGKSLGPLVPVVTHAMYSGESTAASQREAHGITSGITKPVMSHDSHVTHSDHGGGPYLMQNKEYGKLSSPPTTFLTFFGGPPKETHELTNQDQGRSKDWSGSETVTSKFTDSGTFSQKDAQDYDDAIFSEMLELESAKSARRKLVYQEPLDKVRNTKQPLYNTIHYSTVLDII